METPVQRGVLSFSFPGREALLPLFFFFCLIFLGLLVYCLFIVMVTLENMGIGGEFWGVAVSPTRV